MVSIFSVWLSGVASIGGSGSAIMIFLHCFGKLIQLFGHDISNKHDYADEWTSDRPPKGILFGDDFNFVCHRHFVELNLLLLTDDRFY